MVYTTFVTRKIKFFYQKIHPKGLINLQNQLRIHAYKSLKAECFIEIRYHS